MKLINFFIILLLVSGCVTTHPRPPVGRIGLNLAPETLGKPVSLQQHLIVERAGRKDQLDTVLEINSQNLNLVGLVMGHRIMTIHYDGRTLKTWRDPRMPSQVTGENVLEDIELTLWPVEVIQRSLPAGWDIQEKAKHRIVFLNNTPVVDIIYHGNTVILKNLRYHYQLTIQSVTD